MTQEKKNEIRKRALALPTGNLSDAMDHLGLTGFAVPDLHPLRFSQPPAAGFARTIQQRIKGNNCTGKGKVRQRQVINTLTEPGDLLVIDACGCTRSSTGGGLLMLRAKVRGVQGLLTNGCLRDAADIAAMGFPVYCRGVSPVSSANCLETVGVDVPVVIGDVRICPGDLVVMDDSGCVVIPRDRIEEVLDLAEIVQKQEKTAEELLLLGEDFEIASSAGLREFPWPDEVGKKESK